MKALVIKPTYCCQNDFGMGKVIEVTPKNPGTTILRCGHCCALRTMGNSGLFKILGGHALAIERSRVSILPEQEQINLAVGEEVEA